MTQETVDRACMQVEALLEEQGVAAAELQALTERYNDLGTAGVDLARLSDAEWRGYGVDPKHVAVNKRLHRLLQSVRKLGSITPCSYLGFTARPVSAP
ncbi:hypothetical protein GGC65_003969 [Sphingopyxis sp. OAS728]|uniref:hypothetical protein n=1 Tax=Sphingopyxis sp. OAS728 TaxID=2663823 RepID=UPI00178B51DD|nr:hypothetical protein [Sphingopyxis sp. OAS728]MBE1529513.1 hypothetical protein [Sphingopyxis sp. OAS728]